MRPEIRIGLEIPETEAEGPGRRYAIWLQGCTLACPGCCNPELWSKGAGTVFGTDEVLDRIAAAKAGIVGVSILGGEPFEQSAALASLSRGIADMGLDIMIYTGFTLEELLARPDADVVAEVLACTDLLVDGRYDRTKKDETRRFVGSTNQVVHFLSTRYAPDDPVFIGPRTVEIRMQRGRLTMNGWPVRGMNIGGAR